MLQAIHHRHSSRHERERSKMSWDSKIAKKPSAADGRSRKKDSRSFVRAMMIQYVEVLRKYSVIDGRSGRGEFWSFALISAIIWIVLALLALASRAFLFPLILCSLAILLPSIGVAIRRLHDTSRSGWWLLIPYLPFVFLAQDGDAGDNRYDSSASREKKSLQHAIQLSAVTWVLLIMAGIGFSFGGPNRCNGVDLSPGEVCQGTINGDVVSETPYSSSKPTSTEKRVGRYLLYSGLVLPVTGFLVFVVNSDRKKRLIT